MSENEQPKGDSLDILRERTLDERAKRQEAYLTMQAKIAALRENKPEEIAKKARFTGAIQRIDDWKKKNGVENIKKENNEADRALRNRIEFYLTNKKELRGLDVSFELIRGVGVHTKTRTLELKISGSIIATISAKSDDEIMRKLNDYIDYHLDEHK